MQTKPLLVIADDDELQRELLTVWFGHQGFDVADFASGDAMLEWAQGERSPVHAFLLDVDMLGRDGLQSCREVRSLNRYSATPTVFVTASSAVELQRSVTEAGGSALVRKDAEMLPRLTSWVAEIPGITEAESYVARECS